MQPRSHPGHAIGTALVTGVSSGIGEAIAARLARDGWTVVGLDLRSCDRFPSAVCDVGDPVAVDAAVADLAGRFGKISAAVTAAGVWAGTDPFNVDRDLWRKLAAVHVGGTANVLKAVLPAMIASGEGNIVTITTDLALSGNKDDLYYVTVKGAVLGLTRGLARELEATRIRVNSVAPGATDTPILPPDSPWRTAEVLGRLPLPRLVDPSEIAETTAFLCDPACPLTGQVLSPNAGQAI